MLTIRFSAALLALSATLLCQQPAIADEDSPAESFEETVAPFLRQHCFRCHGERRTKADIDLTAFPSTIATAEQAGRWLQVLDQLQTGLMPPRDRKRPEHADVRAVIDWIEASVAASGHGDNHRDKMALPQYGNWVDHDALFDGSHDEPPFTKARIWRRSPYQFAARRGVNRAVKGVQNPFVFATPKNGVRDYAASSQVGASVVETSLINAASELDYLLAQAEREAANAPNPSDKRRRSNPLVPFVRKGTTPTVEQMRAAIQPAFQRLVSRPPTEPELAKYVAFLQQNLRDTGDAKASLRATLTAIYVCPEALYRMEWGQGAVDEHGRRMLSPDELAFALSYALFDTGPFQARGKAKAIAVALENDKLRTREDVVAVLTQILRGEEHRPKSARRHYDVPRVMRFFREFFGFDRAKDVFKDDEHVRKNGLRHDPRRLVNDAENLIAFVLRQDQNVFEELLTTNLALVFHNGDNREPVARWELAKKQLAEVDEEWARKQTERRLKGVAKKPKYKNNPKLLKREQAKIRAEQKTLAQKERKRLQALVDAGPHMQKTKARDRRYVLAYNLDPKTWVWPAEQPFELPRDQRAGILTHPAWLIAHSGNFDTDPIHRGIWVYEKLLAGVIGDVPPDVDARIAEDPHKTLRERMQPLRDRECWKCHYKINPLGEAFEAFDDFGRFRNRFHFDKNEKLVPRKAHTTKPVDASGSFDELGFAELQGDYDNALGMLRTIAGSDRARQSIIRHLFRFFMGRNETLVDSRTLREADRAYLENNGSLRAVIVSLLSSDSFLYRR